MYERSAIVLERYLNKLFGFDKVSNLRENFYNFSDLVEELKEYQTMVTEEEKVINKFEEIAREVQAIQKLQEKLSMSNQKLEDERNKLFNALDENPNTVQNRIEKIEKIVEENNEELKKLREEYIKTFVIFIERQKERNKFARGKRSTETKYISTMKDANEKFKSVSMQDIQNMKRFISGNKTELKNSIIDVMIKNGRNEKIGFNKEVISKAVDVRISIAEKEAECYISSYERLKRILNEVESDNIQIERYEKFLRDNGVKLAFLNAEKEYVIDFLDNERMTVIGGPSAHKKMMEEACKNFEMDIKQIDNLYELILREIAGKSTKKAYNDLYNKTYLRDIQAKERSFEAEVTNIKVNLGTVINSNYWRIEGIKNIYEVFLQEVTEKFEKDLSDYKVEEIDIIDQIEDISLKKPSLNVEEKSTTSKSPFYNNYEYNYSKYKNEYDNDDEDKYENRYKDEYDDNYDEDEYNDEYDDNYDEDEYDDNYDDDEYEDGYDDNYDDDEYEDEYDEDEYDDEYDDDNYDEENVEEYDNYDEYDDNYNENEYEDNEEYDDEYDEDYNINIYGSKKKYNNNYNEENYNEEDDSDYASIISKINNSQFQLNNKKNIKRRDANEQKNRIKDIKRRRRSQKRYENMNFNFDFDVDNKSFFDKFFKKNDY